MVKIIFLDDVKCDKFIFVSWNGSQSVGGEDSVGLDRLFASKLGIKSGDLVLVQAVSDSNKLSLCTSCDVKPCSDVDYQLVMMNADEIESELLGQIRVLTTAFFSETGDHQFNVFPVWLQSSPNVPIYVRVCNFEPKNQKGLILANSTRLVIHSPDEEIVYSSESSSKSPTNDSSSVKSMFGLIRSIVSKVAPAEPTIGDYSPKARSLTSIPLYRGKSRLLRVIPSSASPLKLNYHTASISSAHFEAIRAESGFKENYCIVKMTRLFSKNELNELKKVKHDNYNLDSLTLPPEDKGQAVYVDRVLKIFDRIADFVMLVFEDPNCPDGCIVLNDSFRTQHTIPATSYVQLNEVDESDSGGKISHLNQVAYHLTPVASSITLYPLEMTSDRFKEVSFQKKLLKEFQQLFTSYLDFHNLIFVNNSLIVSFSKINFLLSFNSAELNKCDLERMLTTSVIVNFDTEISFKSVPVKFDTSKLFQKLSIEPQQLDIVHLPPLDHVCSKPFGGFESMFRSCEKFIQLSLNLNNSNNVENLFSSLLIVGGKGSGKSTLIEQIRHHFTSQYVYSRIIDCSQIRGKRIESIQKCWWNTFEETIQRQPSILVFEDLDDIAHDVSGGERRPESTESASSESVYCERVAFVFHRLLSQLKSHKSAGQFARVVLLATCKSQPTLDKTIRYAFDQVISVSPLTTGQRGEIIKEIVEKKDLSLPGKSMKPCIEFNINRLAKATKQYQPCDLDTLIDVALHDSLMKNLNSNSGDLPRVLPVTEDNITHALAESVPNSAQKINLKLHSNRTLADVGGLNEVKQLIINTVMLPVRYPKIFANLPLRAQNSILLYGMPGTGKTLLVEAIANESGLNFIGVKGPELLSKYIGASEQSVRQLFAKAKAAAPCILFFDEFDSLAPRRGHDSTGVTDRIVNQMLTLLDGLEEMQRDVYILAATSRPDLIDLALLRPGRFDRCVACDLPNKAERVEILAALSRNLNVDSSLRLEEIANSTEKFTGADLQALLYNAYLCATRRLNFGQKIQTPIVINEENVKVALESTSPSLSEKERASFNKM